MSQSCFPSNETGSPLASVRTHHDASLSCDDDSRNLQDSHFRPETSSGVYIAAKRLEKTHIDGSTGKRRPPHHFQDPPNPKLCKTAGHQNMYKSSSPKKTSKINVSLQPYETSFHRTQMHSSNVTQMPSSGHENVKDLTGFPIAGTDEDHEEDEEIEAHDSIEPQPDPRPISPLQLIEEVKHIYAGLVMVEQKCTNVIASQNIALRRLQNGEPPPKDQQPYQDHWPALIAVHRTLLHEHHDFFLASQHPAATPALKELAGKYSMPARMWKHGIHNFLELLRQRLPGSLEFMLSFIYLAYQMVALLFDTVGAFKETWIECLGDLARYRMAVEDENFRDRDIWTVVSRSWYQKAIDKSPTTGRLYHHQAILARNAPFVQLSLYCRSLTAQQVFPNTRDSILTLLQPTMARQEQQHLHSHATEMAFVKIHGHLFTKRDETRYYAACELFLSHFPIHVGRIGPRFKEQGTCIAFALIAGVLEYGAPRAKLRRLFEARNKQLDTKSGSAITESAPLASDEQNRTWLLKAMSFFCLTFNKAVDHVGDHNVLPLVHILLHFLLCLVECSALSLGQSTESAAEFPFEQIRWMSLAVYLNSLAHPAQVSALVERTDEFPRPRQTQVPRHHQPSLVDRRPHRRHPSNSSPPTRTAASGMAASGGDPGSSPPASSDVESEKGPPLAEDFAIRGQVWCANRKLFLPEYWCEEAPEDEEVRLHAMESQEAHTWRVERVMWIAARLSFLARQRNWEHSIVLTYSPGSKRFGPSFSKP